MWTRLIALIVIATAILEVFGPWERLQVYYLVIGVAIPLFAIRWEPKRKSSSPSASKRENVIHLDEVRRRKNQENKRKENI